MINYFDMTKHFYLFIALVGFMMVSCSSDEPKTEISQELAEGYRDGTVSKCFKFDKCELFERADESSEWHPVEEWYGEIFYPSMIYFTGGKVLASVEFPSTTDEVYREVKELWEALVNTKKCDEHLYVSTDFQLDNSEKKTRNW